MKKCFYQLIWNISKNINSGFENIKPSNKSIIESLHKSWADKYNIM